MKTLIVIVLFGLGLSGCNTKSKKITCTLELPENVHKVVYGYNDNRISEVEYSLSLSFEAYGIENTDVEEKSLFFESLISAFGSIYGESYITHTKSEEYFTIVVSMPINKDTVETFKQTDIVYIDEDNTVNLKKTIQAHESHGYVCSK
ncbi:MAG: hypothetical protein Q4A47_01200 [Erysipelotrichaceae bacterium]|nr:hypothetical protein [Erysipelotrichaceae bacterium]